MACFLKCCEFLFFCFYFFNFFKIGHFGHFFVFFFLYSTISSGVILWLYQSKDTIDSAVTAYLVNIGLQIVGLLTVAIGFYFGSRAVENLRIGKPRER
jgi:hypothetical protein